MTTLHFVKKARKDNKAAGVKRGESYFWWKFGPRFPKQFSKSRPARSSYMTMSDYLGQLYDLEDGFSTTIADWESSPDSDVADLVGDIESLASEIENLGQEQSDKRDNMPEGLQEGGTGETLQTRADECEEMVDELNSLVQEIENMDTEDESFRDDVQQALEGFSFQYG